MKKFTIKYKPSFKLYQQFCNELRWDFEIEKWLHCLFRSCIFFIRNCDTITQLTLLPKSGWYIPTYIFWWWKAVKRKALWSIKVCKVSLASICLDLHWRGTGPGRRGRGKMRIRHSVEHHCMLRSKPCPSAHNSAPSRTLHRNGICRPTRRDATPTI